jgi:hypothetical protein
MKDLGRKRIVSLKSSTEYTPGLGSSVRRESQSGKRGRWAKVKRERERAGTTGTRKEREKAELIIEVGREWLKYMKSDNIYQPFEAIGQERAKERVQIEEGQETTRGGHWQARHVL